MKTITEIRLNNARTLESTHGRKAVAEKTGMAYQQLSNMIGKKPIRNIGDSIARRLEEAYALPLGWMDKEHIAKPKTLEDIQIQVLEADFENPKLMITLLDVRGSCGGGFLNNEMVIKSRLIKEPAWFKKYKVNNKNIIAIYADGNSMADYIVDGDIVIFDITKTTARNNTIFAVDTPAGTKIKKLMQSIDGSWTLVSNNPDKRSYPDEHITTDIQDQIHIRGEFLYRQGG